MKLTNEDIKDGLSIYPKRVDDKVYLAENMFDVRVIGQKDRVLTLKGVRGELLETGCEAVFYRGLEYGTPDDLAVLKVRELFDILLVAIRHSDTSGLGVKVTVEFPEKATPFFRAPAGDKIVSKSYTVKPEKSVSLEVPEWSKHGFDVASDRKKLHEIMNAGAKILQEEEEGRKKEKKGISINAVKGRNQDTFK